MYVRPVWPALLCVTGAAPLILFFTYISIGAYFLAGQGPYFADLFGLLVPGLWLLLISLLLLLDGARKTVWGVLAVATFGIASTVSFFAFAQILSGTQVGSIALWIVVPVFAGPVIGLVGAVWALFWKPRLWRVVG